MTPVIQCVIIGLVAGLAGGVFGIGGGAIMVPAMVLWMGMAQKMATGTSLVAQLLPVGLLAVLEYRREGNLNLRLGIFLALAMFAGYYAGALFANKPWINEQMVKKAYGVFLLVIGARYLFYDQFVRLFTR